MYHTASDRPPTAVVYWPAVRLKEVTLQGYKSFASKNRFQFPSGITAIVGPNGSGKSNIADAVRWVLGEQRATQLRARRSEELIFHGTEQRSRSGLAEVTLLLDNTDRSLDVDFAEVAVSRRAHRDGSSEYLLNGARVRLRDVLELLGSQLGQSNYTVIGQGMVDSALALRPEDRRSLIDEAAGVLPFQRKRDRVLRQLAETEDNLTRVKDITAELGPRLKRMERLAERARQHRQVAESLESSLRLWYGYQWHLAQAQHAKARATLTEAMAQAQAAREEVQRLEADLRRSEAEAEAADESLATWRSEREAMTNAAAAAHQELAVAQARIESLRLASQDIAGEATTMAQDLVALEGRQTQLSEEVDRLAADHERLQATLAGAQAVLTAAEEAHEAHSAEAEALRVRLFTLAGEMASLRQQAAAVQAQLEVRSAERTRATLERDRLAAEEGPLAEAMRSSEDEHRLAEASLAAVVKELGEREAELALLTAAHRQARDAHEVAQVGTEALKARAGALEALVGDLDEVSPIRSRLAAGGRTVVGTVANLVVVTDGWDAAVAAALGNRVHGIVLRDAAEVAEALALLMPAVGGQVTLVPLQDPELAHDHRRIGSLGRPAAEVVSAPEAPGLVAALLGSTAFAADREAGRDLLRLPDAPAQVATRDGLLLLAGGAVVAGAPGAEMLALQRERRELPATIEAAVADEFACAAEVDRLAAQRRVVEGQVGEHLAARSEAEAARMAAVEALAHRRSELEHVLRRREWAEATLERIAEELSELEAAAAQALRAADGRSPQEAELRTQLESLRSRLVAADLSQPRAAVSEAAAEAARLAELVAGRRAVLASVARDADAARQRLLVLEQRGTELTREVEGWEVRIAALAAAASDHDTALANLGARIAPAESGIRQARGALRHEADLADRGRHRLSVLEARVAEARVAVARAEDRLERLYDQLRADGEWLPDLEELPQQPSLDGGESLGLPLVTELPADLERQLAALRRELRAIGAIDLEALSTYEDTLEHFHQLSAQRSDLDVAERELRIVLEQLETEMQRRFETAFQAVAEAFTRLFPQLFGGGEAALVPTGGGESDAAGIEIVARPPGKRRQPLSLLSGGERALTAVALIFALLEVSATPFVVLDEVDAALDEANVDRFCTALASLAERTQVVIVTHNRNTIQAAGTVYGISMGDDGASQVISLRVDGAA